MKFVSRLSASSLFCWTVAISVLSLVTVGYLSVNTVDTVKVGGHLDDQIIDGKDLLADVLPPPAYIIESYLTTTKLLETADDAEREKLFSTLDRLQKEYFTRLDYWKGEQAEHIVDSKLKQLYETLLTDSRAPAEEFFKAPKANSCRQSKAVTRIRHVRFIRRSWKPSTRLIAT